MVEFLVFITCAGLIIAGLCGAFEPDPPPLDPRSPGYDWDNEPL